MWWFKKKQPEQDIIPSAQELKQIIKEKKEIIKEKKEKEQVENIKRLRYKISQLFKNGDHPFSTLISPFGYDGYCAVYNEEVDILKPELEVLGYEVLVKEKIYHLKAYGSFHGIESKKEYREVRIKE